MKKQAGKKIPLMDKIKERISVDESGCWNWIGAKTRGGYGQVMDGRKNLRAHRASYELFVGPIPDGMFVCHSCDNVRCVNPDHLWLGTAQENAADAASKLRTKGGEENKLSKLSREAVIEIRATGMNIYEAARRFGVSPVTAWKARAGKTWRRVDA